MNLLSFISIVDLPKEDIQKALQDKVQVIVCLPQTLLRNYKLLPKLDRFILDEAHQWYFKNKGYTLLSFKI